MAASSSAEADGLVHWLQGVQRAGLLDKSVERAEDIADGAVLFDVLSHVDPDHFRNPHDEDGAENVVVRIGTLKRLYKLMIQYIAENLQLSASSLEEPDFDALARISAPSEACKLCRLALIIAVQSDKKMSYIGVIQELEQADQQQLMSSIELTRQHFEPIADEDASVEVRTRQPSEEASEKPPSDEQGAAYRKLASEHEARGATIEALEEQVAAIRKQLEQKDEELATERRNVQSQDQRSEVSRLTDELRKCEDALAAAESELDRLQREAREKERTHEEATRKARDFDSMKDQLEEAKHAAEKLQKAESVIDKYKKKLEETADVRRRMKDVEDQNVELIDRISALQEEQTKVNNFKPLMESYKTQVLELESKVSHFQKDLDAARFAKDQLAEKLATSEAARISDREELELYQERVRELELAKQGRSSAPSSPTARIDGRADGDAVLDEELEDALAGTSTTDLKIQLKRMKRERDAAVANKADVSRILVLENLLEDAQRMKARYEADYLMEHQAKLSLSRELEDIRSGKSNSGDGAEANIALRSRLNQVVDELDQTKRDFVALQVQHDASLKELTIAKSDLSLVSKDQVDILHELRASVAVEKEQLEGDVARVQAQLKEAQERGNMLTQQVNGLLMDKIDLQSQGIGHRDEALRRERNLGELRASLAGKALPKEAEDLINALQTSHAASETQVKALQDKLSKARAFIRQQDQLLKERPKGDSASAEAMEQELRLMASAFQDISLRLAQELHSSRGRRTQATRTSLAWMGQQRRAASARLIDR